MLVIANSLPKSGTHLLARFLDLLGLKECRPNLSGSLIRITGRNVLRRYFKRKRIWIDGLNEFGFKVDLDHPENRIRSKWLENIIKTDENNIYRKAHLPYSEELEKFLISLGYKVLFIIRDPRDVVVSYCNHMLRDSNYPLHKIFLNLKSDAERIKTVINGRKFSNGYALSALQNRIENVMGWWESSLTCSVRFEDLIGAQGGGISRVQHEQIKKLTKYLCYQLTSNDHFRISKQIFYPKANTFYKGIIGQWKTKFADSNIDHFKLTCGKYLIKLGYENDMNW